MDQKITRTSRRTYNDSKSAWRAVGRQLKNLEKADIAAYGYVTEIDSASE
jgi:hypothetical protein